MRGEGAIGLGGVGTDWLGGVGAAVLHAHRFEGGWWEVGGVESKPHPQKPRVGHPALELRCLDGMKKPVEGHRIPDPAMRIRYLVYFMLKVSQAFRRTRVVAH